MRDRPIIYAGLAVFLALATFPVWRSVSAGTTTRGPEPVLPKVQRECVAPLAYMKSSHMTLLNEWRDTAVRRGERTFRSAGGQTFSISLTPTCLQQCHAGKQDFCDRCHNYAGVTAECWDCHLDSKPPALRSAR
jgi:hypothetical protein